MWSKGLIISAALVVDGKKHVRDFSRSDIELREIFDFDLSS